MTRAVRRKRGRLSAPDAEKRQDQLLDAATAVFLEQGFSRATMGAIARKAGCSLETLYDLYPNKASMFSVLIERKAAMTFRAVGDLSVDRDHHEALLNFSLELVATIMQPQNQELHRVVVAECPSFPDLGVIFWEEGPGHAQKVVAQYLAKKRRDGTLPVKNCARAAQTFMALLVGNILQRTTLGLDSGAESPRQQKRLARSATESFCKLLDSGLL